MNEQPNYNSHQQNIHNVSNSAGAAGTATDTIAKVLHWELQQIIIVIIIII